MYLTSLYLSLNLDTEVSQFDRERVLRSLRDRLKQAFGNKFTLRTDDDHALVIAFFCPKLEGIAAKCEALLARVESAGEARILASHRQVFAWFEGEFRELEHERTFEGHSAHEQSGWGGFTGTDGHTVIYSHEEDELVEMLPRPTRRQFRIPVRK